VSRLLTIPFRYERLPLVGSHILDAIRDDELVTARVSISANPPIDDPVKTTPQSYLSKHGYLAESGEPIRIQIRLVTAQLARVHARTTLKDGSTTINSIFAFDGAFISGNTSLVTIRCIACTGISDAILFRLHFDMKPLVHLVGSQKMI